MTTSLSTYWRNMANGTASSLPERFLFLLLAPFSLIYALVLNVRALLYRIGLLNGKRLPRPVISIGNLTVGGTGKTPLTAHIARLLLAQGYRVAVLSRGYGGSLEGTCVVVSDGATVMLQPEQCGDEPFLLASTIPGLMVVTGSDRYAAGLMAMEQLSPDLFLLDDGYQHLALQRDLNILLLDCNRPFGNGWTLPAGLLREPPGAARRADLVIHTRCPSPAALTGVVTGRPAVAAMHRLVDALPLQGGDPLPLSALQGHTCLAFAGIAQPDVFFAGLREKGIEVIQTLSFADHAEYDAVRLAEIAAALRNSGAEYAITTEKDGVKLKQLPPDLASVTFMARLDVELEKPAELLARLRNLLQKQ